MTGFSRDQFDSAYFGIRESESSEPRSIPGSRGAEVSSAQNNNRSLNKERFEVNMYEKFSIKDLEQSSNYDKRFITGNLKYEFTNF